MTTTSSSADSVGFCDWLKSEFRKPAGHTGFWGYFIVLILVVGGLGVWISAFQDRTLVSIIGSLLTFFPAISTSACFELVHSDETQPKPKFARNVAIYGGAILTVALLIITANKDTWVGCIVGILASLFALALWWLANANNVKLRDDDPISASGGDANRVPAGETGEYGL
jgi:hypothetical protein